MLRAVLVVAVLAACEREHAKPIDPEPAPTKLRIFTEPEITTLETTLLAQLDENAKRSCVRPLLHGTGVPGRDDRALIEIVQPTGERAHCNRRLAALKGMATGDPTTADAERAAYLEIAKDCGTAILEPAVEASLHQDACSPYQPGRHAEPTDWVVALSAAKLIGVYAGLHERHPTDGLWMLLDALLAYQDLARGHANLVTTTVAGAGTQTLVSAALELLAKTALSPADSATLGTAVDALLASESPFGDTLLGETEHMALYLGLARLKPDDWAPPGGTTKELRELATAEPTKGNVDPRDQAALLLAMPAKLRESFESVCREPNAKRCFDELAALTKTLDETSAKNPADPATLMAKLVAEHGRDTPEAREKVRKEVQELVVTTLAASSGAGFEEYAAKRARAITALVALRYALAIEKDGRCPSAKELGGFHERAWAARSLAVLGEAPALSLEKGTLHVAPPEDLHRDKLKDFVIGCP